MSGLRPVLRSALSHWFAIPACKPDTGPATPLPPVASVARLTSRRIRRSANRLPHPSPGRLAHHFRRDFVDGYFVNFRQPSPLLLEMLYNTSPLGS